MKWLSIKSWADFLYLTTLIYLIFCIVIYCVPFQVTLYPTNSQGEINMNAPIKEVTLAQWWSFTNEKIKGFRFTIMIVGLIIPCLIIDWILINLVWKRFTKIYKVEKYQLAKKYQEMKDESKNKSKA